MNTLESLRLVLPPADAVRLRASAPRLLSLRRVRAVRRSCIEPCPLCIFQRIAHGGGRRGRPGRRRCTTRAVARRPHRLGPAGLPRRRHRRGDRRAPRLAAAPAARPGAGLRPGAAYMVESMPSWLDVVKKVLHRLRRMRRGRTGRLLGFSMPEWTLLCFVLLAIGALVAGFRSADRALICPCHDAPAARALKFRSHESARPIARCRPSPCPKAGARPAGARFGAGQQPAYPDAGRARGRARRAARAAAAGHLVGDPGAASSRSPRRRRASASCCRAATAPRASTTASPALIANRLKILLQMSLVLVHGLRLPVIRVGRFAGQYAKPRSADTGDARRRHAAGYRGDLVNRAGVHAPRRARRIRGAW